MQSNAVAPHHSQPKTKTRYTYSSNTDTTGTAVTSTYTYDTAGNLRSASDGTSTLSYEYNNNDWKDLLTKVGGTTISYDGSGNPTNWYNGAKSYSGLTWQNGRQLARITVGGKTSKYTYDADGIRSTKDVNGTKHEYRTLNGKVVWEKIGEGTSAKIMVFSYDAQGRPFGFKFSKDNGTKFTNYFYALNQQGDVVKIFRPVAVKDADGNVTGYTEKTYATYTYDAWGKLTGILDSGGNNLINKQTTSTALANLNPLRYRGYYYDNETGFYYLQSRYYDPAVKRFINADAYSSTGQGFVGTNMFVYCGNNPVARVDANGLFWEEIVDFLAGIFGAGATFEEQVSPPPVETVIAPFNQLITSRIGTRVTTQLAKYGDSSKPISVYAVGRADGKLLSSAGIKLNIAHVTIGLSLGLDNIGLSAQYLDDDVQQSYAIKVNLSQAEVGFESARTQTVEGLNVSKTDYTFSGITFLTIVTAVAFVVAPDVVAALAAAR